MEPRHHWQKTHDFQQAKIRFMNQTVACASFSTPPHTRFSPYTMTNAFTMVTHHVPHAYLKTRVLITALTPVTVPCCSAFMSSCVHKAKLVGMLTIKVR